MLTRFFQILLFFSLLLISDLQAGDLSQPFELETSATLPQGITNLRLKMVARDLKEGYGDSGTLQPLSQPIVQKANWSQVYGLIANPAQRQGVQNAVNFVTSGKTSEGPGASYGDVSTSARVAIPLLAYGVTPALTLAVAVPVYQVSIQASAGFNTSEEAQKVAAVLNGAQPGAGTSLLTQLDQAVTSQTQAYGYKPIENQSYSAIGDAKVYSKIRLLQTEKDRVTFRPAWVLPTGRQSDPDRLVDVATGDGQFDLESTLFWDHRFNRILSSTLYGRYTVQFSDDVDRRIPTSPGSLLSPDKERVSRDLGDQVAMGFALTVQPLKGFSIGAGYDFQHMNATSYSGARFAPERYTYLSDLYPAQSLHTLVVSAGYSTASLYRDGLFAVPLEINFNYSQTLTGKNIYAGNVFSGELAVFF